MSRPDTEDLDRRGSISIPFLKMEGCGNDYVHVDLSEVREDWHAIVDEEAAPLARRISDRRFGVGADGLVLIRAAEDADASMHMYNADGSIGAVCGNALRCVAKQLGETRYTGRGRLEILTDSGIREAALERAQDGQVETVEIDMGAPRFAASEIPLRLDRVSVLGGGETEPWRIRVEARGGPYEGRVLSMGNPHLVIFVESDVAKIELGRIGPGLETADFFPDRCNIEIVQVGEGLRQRTWERGSGETLACGSGACAAVVAAVSRGLAGRGERVQVGLRGGELGITWTESGSVLMRGPARRVFSGTYYYQD